MRARLSFLAVLLLSSSWTAAAAADAVGPPPDSCPPGSTPQSSHAGPLCSPTAECSSDAMCSGSATCMSVSQCIETRDCGGRRPPDSGPCTVSHVVGPCASDGSCSVGVCQTRSVCSSGSSGGCSCRAAGSGQHAVLALALTGVLGLALARRRLRRRAHP